MPLCDITVSIIASHFVSTSLKNAIFPGENSAHLSRSIRQKEELRCSVGTYCNSVLQALSAFPIMLTRTQACPLHGSFYAPASIYDLGIANRFQASHMSSSSGVRANVNVCSPVLLEKWWWAKMLAGWKCLDMQNSISFCEGSSL